MSRAAMDAREDFADRRVLLSRPDDGATPIRFGDMGGHWQSSDGPAHLVIGAKTTDADCTRWSRRFGVPVGELIAYRDAAG